MFEKIIEFIKNILVRFNNLLGDKETKEIKNFIKNNKELIVESVKEVEKIAKYTLNLEELEAVNIIQRETGYIISTELMEKIKNGGIQRNKAKRELAEKIVYDKLKILCEKVIVQGVNIGIELAVLKLKGIIGGE